MTQYLAFERFCNVKYERGFTIMSENKSISPGNRQNMIHEVNFEEARYNKQGTIREKRSNVRTLMMTTFNGIENRRDIKTTEL